MRVVPGTAAGKFRRIQMIRMGVGKTDRIHQGQIQTEAEFLPHNVRAKIGGGSQKQNFHN
jgi:hypothetical protein